MYKSTKPSQVPSVPAKTTKVHVDSSVILRVVKHGYEQFPQTASGQLLGFDDNEQVLDVSNAFPFPHSANENDGQGMRSNNVTKYTNEMITNLKEVNVDSNPVGFYVSSNMGKFYNQTIIENLLACQNYNREAILLVYDVSKSNFTGLSLKAYRLSPQFLQVKASGKFSTEQLVKNELSHENLLQELPITISNSHLVTMYLHTLKREKNFDHLNISIDSFLEKNIEGIFDSVDEFHYDQGNYNFYQRQMTREKTKIQQWQQKRKAENNARQQRGEQPLSTEEWRNLFKVPEEPSRLDNLTISAQLDQYCNQIDQFGNTVNSKLFAVQKSLDK